MEETVEQYAARRLLETILGGMQGDQPMADNKDPKDPKLGEGTHPTTTQDQPTTPQAPGTKKSTGTPMPEHVASMKATPTRARRANVGTQIRFRILHTAVGTHNQGDEVSQEQLKVDDAGLERLLDLEAVEPVLVDPTADEDDEDGEED